MNEIELGRRLDQLESRAAIAELVTSYALACDATVPKDTVFALRGSGGSSLGPAGRPHGSSGRVELACWVGYRVVRTSGAPAFAA